jgi:hypothetical protein
MELTTTWKEEGQQAEALNLTMRLLTRRFGTIESDLEQRINRLSLPQVEQLFDAAYDFTRLDDLRTWLDTNPSDAPGSDTG